MYLICRVIFVTTLVALLSPSVFAGETAERQSIQSGAFLAFSNSQFEALDSLAAEYRSKASRLPSGVWKLTFFYLGIADRAPWTQKDPTAWQQLDSETQQWVIDYPKSPTAILVRGIVMENHAWSLAEADRRAPMTDDQKKTFLDSLSKTREFLLKNKVVGSQDPHWYVSMIRVATALRLPKQEIMAIVKESSSRKPYYYQTYFAAVDYFSPKWGGDAETLDGFIRAVVEETRGEEGMALYSRIYWAALQSWYAADIWPALNWPDFRQGVHDVLKKYPDQWNLNSFARFACVAQDMKLAVDMFKEIENPDKDVWGTAADFKTCRDWSTTGSTSSGDRAL